MSKISSISGFPEWLPQQKMAEDRVIALIKSVYESYGFTPIETPAVELMSTLAAKGAVDKEIYQVIRAQAAADAEADIGLHFDLTVPLARYVAQHLNDLQFPFKRYQLQKVWRGERPQRGRFREFYQFDIDVIARETLPLSFDAEVIEVLDAAFRKINFVSHLIKLNNRKLLQGFYRKLGLDEVQRKGTITAVDKINKIGPDGVQKELRDQVKLAADVSKKVVEFSARKIALKEAEEQLPSLISDDPWCAEGVQEILSIKSMLPDYAQNVIEIDMSLARGLDYYTGTIIEVVLPKYPEFGSVAGGGRYEDLASQFISKKLPGVGLTIGLSRLMELAISENLLGTDVKSTSAVLLTVLAESQRPACNDLARKIRGHGVNCEVFASAPKLGKQIDYAAGKNIPIVLFMAEDGSLEAKTLATKEQAVVKDLSSWCESLRALKSA